jgi:polyisoprenoid-binding protein YceI
MKKQLIIICLLFTSSLLSFLESTAQNSLKIDPKSTITFAIKNSGITVEGSFTGLVLNVQFEDNQLDKATISASVDANTINTGIEMRDAHLRKPDYFDTKNFPRITMESVSFTKEGASYKGIFKLTIKGITRQVVLPFTLEKTTTTAVFKGSFTINRLDFKVGSSSWILSNNVTIYLDIHTK